MYLSGDIFINILIYVIMKNIVNSSVSSPNGNEPSTAEPPRTDPVTHKEALDAVRNLVLLNNLNQDFIFLIGLYRIEYHAKTQIFVLESRMFDTVNLDESSPD